MSFKPSQKNEQDFNGGTKYKNGDGLHADTVNNVIESLLWSQSIATNQPNIENINGDGTPSVSIEEFDGTPRFKFQNLKGEKGIDGKVNVVQTTGVSETDAMSQKASSTTFANAIKQTASGEFVNLTDVSPNVHPVSVKVRGVADPTSVKIYKRGKNLFQLWDFYANGFTQNGITLTPNADGSITFNGTATVDTNIGLIHQNLQKLPLPPAKITIFSTGVALPSGCRILTTRWKDGTWLNNLATQLAGASATYFVSLTRVDELEVIFFVASGTTLTNFTIYPQIEIYNGHIDWRTVTDGSNYATPYEPYHCEIYTPKADGTIDGVLSVSPTMNFVANMDGVNIEVEYIKDIGEAIKQTANAFPFEKYAIPTLYFDGNIIGMSKDNAVTLNYKYGDRTGTCTLKWQGSSSIVYPKKNYTVKFDNAFEAVDGWGEEKKYCLKADWIDFSHCRNVVSAKLWGDVVRTRETSELVTKLSALPNCGAIDGFPCFVVINGEWMGVYNFNIPKDGYMFGMGDGTKEAILCADKPNGSGTTWFALATIGEDYELEYVTDEDNADWVQTSLNTLITACMNSDGTDIDTTIAQYLDINSAIDYYIYCACSFNGDGIGKNHLLATYDGVKWFFSAYDLDSTWGMDIYGNRFSPADTKLTANMVNSFKLMATKHRIFYLIYNYARERLIARYKELRDSALSVSAVTTRFYNYALQFPANAKKADAEKWTEIPSTDVNNVAQIVGWYIERARLLDEEIAEMEATLSE